MAIVYEIKFSNGKRYIGITKNDLSVRKSEHISRAKASSKLAVHCALRKYKNVEWNIVVNNLSYEEAKNKEKELIKSLDTFAPNGYNLTKGGDGSHGFKISEEQRRRLSDSHKGKKWTNEHRIAFIKTATGCKHKDGKSVLRINPKDGSIKRYNRLSDTTKDGFLYRLITKVCSGERKTHGGYEWRYK